jgi:hypothetical protein
VEGGIRRLAGGSQDQPDTAKSNPIRSLSHCLVLASNLTISSASALFTYCVFVLAEAKYLHSPATRTSKDGGLFHRSRWPPDSPPMMRDSASERAYLVC